MYKESGASRSSFCALLCPIKDFDIVVIGGGIVGLSTAMHATRQYPQLRLLLVEKEDGVARHQSGHNSGVIHSGVYYKPGSLKAKLCVEGAAAMVEFCREHNLKHEVCGKVIVATTEAEIPRLKMLFERGQANGLAGLRMLQADQLREIEPHCSGLLGLLVPSTGITDYAAVSRKYAEIVGAQGGTISTGTEVQRVVRQGSEMIVETTRGAFAAGNVINCAGLAQRSRQPHGRTEAGSQDRALSRRILRPGSGEDAPGTHSHLSCARSQISLSRSALHAPHPGRSRRRAQTPCSPSSARATSAPISIWETSPER